MLPDFPPEDILRIEAKWSKKDLQRLARENWLDPGGDKELLIRKLLYVGALDEEGELVTDREIEPVGAPTVSLYAKVNGNPIKKFCCRLCGDCAPEELLHEGRFLDRISWLRKHYAEKHPGEWGKSHRAVAGVPQTIVKTTTEGAAGEAFRLKQRGWTGAGRYSSSEAAIEAAKAMGKAVDDITLVESRGAYDLYVRGKD